MLTDSFHYLWSSIFLSATPATDTHAHTVCKSSVNMCEALKAHVNQEPGRLERQRSTLSCCDFELIIETEKNLNYPQKLKGRA